METKEKWLDVVGYEGLYQVSNFGRVKSLPRETTSGRVLKPHINKRNGYVYITLSRENKQEEKRVHILVANAFIGANQEGLQVNHKDGNKTNNNVTNLEYCTQSENMKHAYAVGLEKPRGLKVIDLDTLAVFSTATEASRVVVGKNGGGEMVARVCRGERSHYRNHRFAFYDDYINDKVPQFKGKHKKKASDTLWR